MVIPSQEDHWVNLKKTIYEKSLDARAGALPFVLRQISWLEGSSLFCCIVVHPVYYGPPVCRRIYPAWLILTLP